MGFSSSTFFILNMTLYRNYFYIFLPFCLFLALQCKYETPPNEFLEDCPLRLNDNPNAPLVGIGEFSTKLESTIRVEVIGKNPIVTNFNEYKTDHNIPIFGLYLNRENTIRITATSRSGEVVEQNCTLNTELGPDQPLPAIPEITIIENKIKPDDKTRLYLTSSINARNLPNLIIDTAGEIRYYWAKEIYIYSQLKNKNFLASYYRRGVMDELDILGNEVQKFDYARPHHSLIQLPNKNIALFIGNFFIEIDYNTHQEVSRINLPKELPCLRPKVGKGFHHPIHHNWITYDENDNTFLLSLRDQSAVYKINATTKEVKWILGYPYAMDMLDSSCQSKFFTSSIPKKDWFSGQHSPILLPNGNIAVFDNHANAEFTTLKELEAKREAGEEANFIRRKNRILEYSIDERNQTAELVWQYEPDERLVNPSQGSVRYLPDNDHYLVLFPESFLVRRRNHGFMVEIDRGTKEVVFKARFETGDFYYTADLFDAQTMTYLSDPE